MQLIYLNDIFEDNYNNERDLFETDAGNVIKKEFQYLLAWLSLSEIVTRNNNT